MKKTYLLLTFLMLYSFILLNAQNNINSQRVDYFLPQQQNNTEFLPIAANITLSNINNDTYTLNLLKGKYVVVYFWASWSNASVVELQKVQKLYEKFKKATFKNSEGFEMFTVSIDSQDKAWKQICKDKNFNWKYNLNDKDGLLSSNLAKYGRTQIPAIYLIHPNGKLIDQNIDISEIDNYLTKEALLNYDKNIAFVKANQNDNIYAMQAAFKVTLGDYKGYDNNRFNQLTKYGQLLTENTPENYTQISLGHYKDISNANICLQHVKAEGFSNAYIAHDNVPLSKAVSALQQNNNQTPIVLTSYNNSNTAAANYNQYVSAPVNFANNYTTSNTNSEQIYRVIVGKFGNFSLSPDHDRLMAMNGSIEEQTDGYDLVTIGNFTQEQAMQMCNQLRSVYPEVDMIKVVNPGSTASYTATYSKGVENWASTKPIANSSPTMAKNDIYTPTPKFESIQATSPKIQQVNQINSNNSPNYQYQIPLAQPQNSKPISSNPDIYYNNPKETQNKIEVKRMPKTSKGKRLQKLIDKYNKQLERAEGWDKENELVNSYLNDKPSYQTKKSKQASVATDSGNYNYEGNPY